MNSPCPLTCQTDAVWLINAVIVPGEQAEVEGMPASSGVFERWQGQCLREVVATGGPRVPGRQRQAHSSVKSLQALVVLALDLVGSSNGPPGWNIMALITRSVVQLGLAVESTSFSVSPNFTSIYTLRAMILPEPKDFIEEESRRRLFWMIYLLDRYATIATAFEFALDDKEIDRTLPCRDDLWIKNQKVETRWFRLQEQEEPNTEYDVNKPENLGAFSYYIEILAILSKVHKFLKLPVDISALSDVEQWQMRYKELDNMLTSWKFGLPGEYGNMAKLFQPGNKTLNCGWVMLHATYHTAVIRLHSSAAYPTTRSPIFTPSYSASQRCHGAVENIAALGDAGSYEDGRTDSGDFDAGEGRELEGWPGEYWLDTNSETTNRNGLGLTAADSIDYISFLAFEARRRGLAMGLKNGGSIIKNVLPVIDFSVNEECAAYSECDLYKAVTDAGKPVFHIEYPDMAKTGVQDKDARRRACKAKGAGRFNTVMKGLDLDGWVQYCDGDTNRNGLGLTAADSIDYITFLAFEARRHRLAMGLKNGGSIIKNVLPIIDFSVNEECAAYGECDLYKAVTDAGKPVFHIEYPDMTKNGVKDKDARRRACKAKGAGQFSTVMKGLDLDGWVQYCDGYEYKTKEDKDKT
ncbi:hypothetical protein BN1723_001380 [Verticillium longisporum]|uniref:alpha-galactosidase n=1 Tax=Verticillium longisporum TaxID=100787 RepID=A0A0G4NNS4_VERLO|nr:hypothetical protein BN1723_001380 [Verticillium longisporum]